MSMSRQDVLGILRSVRPVMQNIHNAETVSDRLMYAADFEYLYSTIREMINALAESLDKEEMQGALDYFDSKISMLANEIPKKGSYDPNNGTPQA